MGDRCFEMGDDFWLYVSITIFRVSGESFLGLCCKIGFALCCDVLLSPYETESPYVSKNSLWSLLTIAITYSTRAEDLVPTLGKKGAELLSESFDGKDIPKGWSSNTA